MTSANDALITIERLFGKGRTIEEKSAVLPVQHKVKKKRHQAKKY